VAVTQGATEAIYQAMSTLLSPGDETIVSDPGWPHIANFARALGSKVVSIPVYADNAQYKLLPEMVAEKITPRTRLITVVDPLNPLGSSYSEHEIQTLCELAERNDAYLLHDATYRDFATDGHFPAIRYSQRAVMNISLSKICGFAGLRVGATIAAPELMTRIADHQVSRLGGNWVAQRGAIAAYSTKEEWRPRVLELSRRHQTQLRACVEELEGLTAIAYPASGNFLAIDVSGAGLDAEDVVREMLDAGIVIRSGGYTSERFGNRFVRVTTTVPEAHINRFCAVFPGAVERVRASA
jgi:aspartate/methionine/tyrosine aminotransferase